MDGRFYGLCYAYQTPNDGLKTIGVTEVLGGMYAVCWVTDNGSKKRIRSVNLPVLDDPKSVQALLDRWAAIRALEEVA